MELDSEYSESSTISFEWTLRGLKNLFDSTKGDKKSKVTKSIRFGRNRWQILFYANAGQTKDGTEGGFVSLYLSCEPTPEEKEAALSDSGRWVRDGVYKFSFELRNVGKSVLYNSKEAHNHSFTYKTANWGWAQFARRDSVYYQSMPVKAQDAFVIICTITSSPATPPPPSLPRQPVPKSLLDTVGALLDDPLYSDVQFVIPRRGQNIKNGRTIWASKRLLQRAEYFQSMFSSNFAEGAGDAMDQTPRSLSRDLISPTTPHMSLIMDEFEDSDNEDDEELLTSSPLHSNHDMVSDSSAAVAELSMLLADSSSADSDKQEPEGTQSADSSVPSPRSSIIEPPPSVSQQSRQEASVIFPKMTVVVRDVAYTTYRAMLYYIYTDNVVFAPLSSSFLTATPNISATPAESLPSTPSEGPSQGLGVRYFSMHETSLSRTEWIREWMRNNPGRPAPCSAKAMYRVADRLDLWELKERAAQHILKSLTVENIAYEVFSPFAATFEAIRKVEIEFFLSHWHDIRTSSSMKNVWVQIRNGRHPGFEEVWPLIAQSLEFKAVPPTISVSTKSSEFAG
ncbi:hypothetical protein B0H34DRAFT_708202 [Crassisporium funariophilum]|nr:hypothetical protein B0H34DRAFT_708202 [Crassisporium funariophilum]